MRIIMTLSKNEIEDVIKKHYHIPANSTVEFLTNGVTLLRATIDTGEINGPYRTL